MKRYKFIFRNPHTGELRTGEGFALAPAAINCGINYTRSTEGDPLSRGLTPPWQRWECWEEVGSRKSCIWHMTEDGGCISGPRPAEPAKGR
jgi:hypothetical protein